MEKLFWGATEIAEYANVSRSSAINFMKRMRISMILIHKDVCMEKFQLR